MTNNASLKHHEDNVSNPENNYVRLEMHSLHKRDDGTTVAVDDGTSTTSNPAGSGNVINRKRSGLA
jgi:hypothetical protein